MGYSRAGFDVVGVDLSPDMAAEYARRSGSNENTARRNAEAVQERYPFPLIHADALEYLAAHWREYDAFHASPPCQGYSTMGNLPWIHRERYALLIEPVREMFRGIHEQSGKPWVIENVEGAKWGSKNLAKWGIAEHGMQAGFLCGTMFGLRMYRHRLFETSFFWMAPAHGSHRFKQGMPGAPKPLGAWEQGYEVQHPGESPQAATAMVDAPFSGHDDTPFWKRDSQWRREHGWHESAKVKTRTELRRLPGQVRAAAGIVDGASPRNASGKGPAGGGMRAVGVQTPKHNHGRDGVAFNDQAIGLARDGSLAAKQQGSGNGAQGEGVGHAKGWRLAAEAMGVSWMDRHGTTQAVPPKMTTYLGEIMMGHLAAGHGPEGAA
jgi:hypothetical protein